MALRLSSLDALPKPEGAGPFVVSSEIYLRLAYPVSREYRVAFESVTPLGQGAADSIQAYFNKEWRYRVFEREWLYAICESGISSGYKVTNHERGLLNHPLATIGLTPKNIFELINSPWIVERQTNASAVPTEISTYPRDLTHYVFAFDDTVFECATTHFTVEYVFGTVYEISTYIAGSLKWWP